MCEERKSDYSPFNDAANTLKIARTLLGFCEGILADGEINDIEIASLYKFLESHQAHC